MINQNNHLIHDPDPVKKPDVPDSPRPTSPEAPLDPPEPYPVGDRISDSDGDSEPTIRNKPDAKRIGQSER